MLSLKFCYLYCIQGVAKKNLHTIVSVTIDNVDLSRCNTAQPYPHHRDPASQDAPHKATNTMLTNTSANS